MRIADINVWNHSTGIVEARSVVFHGNSIDFEGSAGQHFHIPITEIQKRSRIAGWFEFVMV